MLSKGYTKLSSIDPGLYLIQSIYVHSLKHRPGGWGLIPEMIQVSDYDILIVLIELHTLIYVRPLNEWQILKLGYFEVGNFGQNWHFFGYNDFFLTTGVRATSNGSNES